MRRSWYYCSVLRMAPQVFVSVLDGTALGLPVLARRGVENSAVLSA